jgi:hypothetical protein
MSSLLVRQSTVFGSIDFTDQYFFISGKNLGDFFVLGSELLAVTAPWLRKGVCIMTANARDSSIETSLPHRIQPRQLSIPGPTHRSYRW